MKHRLSLLLMMILVLSGCAHRGSVRTYQEELPLPQQARAESNSTPSQNLRVQGVVLQNTDFDYPVVVNSRVEQWVDYFTGRGREVFGKYLKRSEVFIPYLRKLLKENNMPEDLVFLAMIESGFNNHAYSRARAVGPWQFIEATGKRYGLKISWWVDERRNVEKSTRAAIQYLRHLYEMFGTWELASAAYNAGETKVGRAIRRFRTRDFWAIARHRFLRPETRHYVPKIMAAAIVAKNRTQFGFPEQYSHDLEQEDVTEGLPDPEAQMTDDDEKVLISILSDYEEDYQEMGKSTPAVYIDSEEVEDLPSAEPIPTPHVSKEGEIGFEELVEFEVQGPADLLKIGRAAGLSYQQVKRLNPEILRWCTPPSQKAFRVKLPSSVKERFLSTYNHPAFPREVKFRTYKVRRGDTLYRIARRFGILITPLKELNGIRSHRTQLRAGTRIKLPIPVDRSRSLASLDLRDHPRRRYRRHRTTKRYRRATYQSRKAAARKGKDI